jgi:phosphoglucomutase
VDGSVSERQGLQLLFSGGRRAVLRLSGTGTSGATLRLYGEAFERDPTRLELDTQRVLGPLFEAVEEITGLSRRLERDAPDVIN